jgi:hypothetical protein
MPLYEYLDKKTGKIYEELRKSKDRNKPFYSPEGNKCKKIISRFDGWKGNREIYELDSDYVKKMKPKYIRTRANEKIRYDPTKHC